MKVFLERIVSPFLRKHMHEKLRIEGGLCYSCSSFIYTEDTMRVCEDSVEVAQENLDKLIEQYFEHLKNLPENLDKDFFEKEKTKIVESENFDFERIMHINGRVFNYYDNYNILYSSKYRNYDIEQIKKLTYEEVNEAYKSVYKQKPFIVILTPFCLIYRKK